MITMNTILSILLLVAVGIIASILPIDSSADWLAVISIAAFAAFIGIRVLLKREKDLPVMEWIVPRHFSITHAAETACLMATSNRTLISFQFEGISFIAAPSTTPSDIVRSYVEVKRRQMWD